LGHLREAAGFPAEALPYYIRSLEDDPVNVEIKLALGVLYTRTGQLRKAEQLLKEAAMGTKEPAVIENNLAVICLREKRFTEAEMQTNCNPGMSRFYIIFPCCNFLQGKKNLVTSQ